MNNGSVLSFFSIWKITCCKMKQEVILDEWTRRSHLTKRHKNFSISYGTANLCRWTFYQGSFIKAHNNFIMKTDEKSTSIICYGLVFKINSIAEYKKIFSSSLIKS